MAKNNFNINIEKSIKRRKLTFNYKESWLSIIDKVSFYFLFLALLAYPTIIILFEADFSNPNDTAFSIAFALIIMFAFYGFYRKIVENHLTHISTKNSTNKIKLELISFLKRHGIYDIKEGKDCIIAHEISSLSINKLHGKTYTFIINDSELYFNIIKSNPKVNLPVFFSHILLKYDLKKLFRQVNLNNISKNS